MRLIYTYISIHSDRNNHVSSKFDLVGTWIWKRLVLLFLSPVFMALGYSQGWRGGGSGNGDRRFKAYLLQWVCSGLICNTWYFIIIIVIFRVSDGKIGFIGNSSLPVTYMNHFIFICDCFPHINLRQFMNQKVIFLV